uniref:Zinc finger protein, FOG family member 1 n=1 Tax=Propithecus coquereli TaxID=379532 RepID=A0A2K6F773_PROCO
MESREEVQATDASLAEREAAAPEPRSPSSADVKSPPPPPPPTSPGGPEETEGTEPGPREEEEEESGSPWSGPDELEPVMQDGRKHVRARLSLAAGLCWGPFAGNVQTRASSPRQAEPRGAISALAPSVQTHRTR